MASSSRPQIWITSNVATDQGIERMIDNTAPTSEFLLAVQWLGCVTNKGSTVPAGSGVVVHHQGGEYLATALHVARVCGFQPLVRRNSQWSSTQWETVGIDESADVAVLKTNKAKLSGLTPRYGFAHVLIGAVGRAMGFPALSDPMEISYIGEIHSVPLPLTTLVSAYFRPGTDAGAGIHYVGGYINAGFSGGAMLLPTSEGWSIGGIITHREGVLRNVYHKNPGTGQLEKDEELVIGEPSGLIRFAGIGIVTDLIERSMNQS